MTVDHSPQDDLRLWSWLRLALGVVAIAIGIAALSWPAATVRVVGVLFGLNLLITGLGRAILSLLTNSYPVLYRFIGVVFGVLTAVLGIICLRNVIASAFLLVLVVAIGWLLDGLTELALGAMGGEDPLRAWRLGMGALVILAAVVVLVWPGLTLVAFLSVAAILVMLVGAAQIVTAITALRSRRGDTDSTPVRVRP